MDYAMELMSEIDSGDNDYLIDDNMSWDYESVELEQ